MLPLHARRSQLWSNVDFRRFWAGQTVSLLGSRVTGIALPLTAILTLHAGALQIGVLEAAGTGASLVFALPVGIWVDRVRRKPLMIAANLGRAMLLLSIPLASWWGILRMPQLVVVAFLTASLAVIFNIGRTSFLPAIVSRDHLVEANSVLSASASAAQIAGPGVGGLLVQLLTAPIAILADAISFLISTWTLVIIRAAEPVRARVEERSMGREAMEGIGAVLWNPYLRSLAGASATFSLFDSLLFAVYLLYMSQTLHLSAASIGVVFGLAGAGGLIAALLVAPLTRRLGLGRTILIGIVLSTGGELLIAGARGSQLLAILVLLAAEGAVELGDGLYSINVSSLQQAITPDALRGRVSATIDLMSYGTAPVGALAGGVLGATIGLRQTVLVAGAGTLLSLIWLLRSPVRALHETPSTSQGTLNEPD